MFWKHLNEQKRLAKISLWSYLFVGGFLIFFNILILTILDPSISSISSFPLLRAVRLIEIADFLERVDPLVILLIYVGLFVKMTAFYLGAALGLSSLWKNSRHGVVTLLTGGFIYLLTFTSPSYIFHIWIAFEYNLRFHFPVFQIWIPLLLAATIAAKGIFSKKGVSSR